MRLGTGRILEIRQTTSGNRHALIQLDGISPPHAGQYLQAHNPADESHAAGYSLFPGGLPLDEQEADIFITAGPIPSNWNPGDILQMRGPLGKGFQLPEEASRLALIAFSPQTEHLLPLAAAMLARGGEVAMFIQSDPDSIPYRLPASIEVNQLEQIEYGLKWADFAACSVDLEGFPLTSDFLSGLSPLGCPCNVLIYGQMPCAGLAECGICAVRFPRGGSKLICKDGPVLDWQKIS